MFGFRWYALGNNNLQPSDPNVKSHLEPFSFGMTVLVLGEHGHDGHSGVMLRCRRYSMPLDGSSLI